MIVRGEFGYTSRSSPGCAVGTFAGYAIPQLALGRLTWPTVPAVSTVLFSIGLGLATVPLNRPTV